MGGFLQQHLAAGAESWIEMTLGLSRCVGWKGQEGRAFSGRGGGGPNKHEVLRAGAGSLVPADVSRCWRWGTYLGYN